LFPIAHSTGLAGLWSYCCACTKERHSQAPTWRFWCSSFINPISSKPILTVLFRSLHVL